MTFTLKNVPIAFPRETNGQFFWVKWQLAFVYLDDIFIFSEPVKQHLNHLGRLLTLLRNASVTLKHKTVLFLLKLLTTWVMSLTGRLEMAEATTSVIHVLQYPNSETEVGDFLQLCSVHRRFATGLPKTGSSVEQEPPPRINESVPDCR